MTCYVTWVNYNDFLCSQLIYTPPPTAQQRSPPTQHKNRTDHQAVILNQPFRSLRPITVKHLRTQTGIDLITAPRGIGRCICSKSFAEVPMKGSKGTLAPSNSNLHFRKLAFGAALFLLYFVDSIATSTYYSFVFRQGTKYTTQPARSTLLGGAGAGAGWASFLGCGLPVLLEGDSNRRNDAMPWAMTSMPSFFAK